VRQRLVKNFSAWIDAIDECLQQAKLPFASDAERRELAQFVLTTMEGGVMQARTFRDLAYFDASVCQLRRYVDRMLAEANRQTQGENTCAR
jgi:TetR/AcrR family transcriptional repressor of nem operon